MPDPVRLEEATRSGLVAPDAVLDFSALYPDGPIIRGLEAWRSYSDSMPWGGSLKLEPERFFDVDDERVLVFIRATAEGEGSGFRSRVEPRTSSRFEVGSAYA